MKYGLSFLLIIALAGVFVVVFISKNRQEQSSASSITPNQENTMSEEFTLISSAFEDGALMPTRYTCDGDNINPPLSWIGVPEGTQSLALTLEDPDVPVEVREDQMFTHWVLFNISPEVTGIGEGIGEGVGIVGKNTAGSTSYTGPCPPTQYEPTEHRYVFRLYALDSDIDLEEGATKEDLLEAIEGHVLDEDELTGRYDRTQREE